MIPEVTKGSGSGNGERVVPGVTEGSGPGSHKGEWVWESREGGTGRGQGNGHRGGEGSGIRNGERVVPGGARGMTTAEVRGVVPGVLVPGVAKGVIPGLA